MVHMPRLSATPESHRNSSLRRSSKARRLPQRRRQRRPKVDRPTELAPPKRYCPLCDEVSTQSVCPHDGVRTVSASWLDGAIGLVRPGMIIGGAYRIDHKLGEGAMGHVFAGTQLSVDRPVAIKFMTGLVPKDRDELRRFFREAYLAGQLDHPNIVKMIEFGVDERTSAPFLVMGFVSGENLRTLLDREGPLEPTRAARLMGQVARALNAAHRVGIVHRDLKPANLMVTRLANGDEQVIVIDFGVAKSMGQPTRADLSQSGVVVGTPLYMSPEQAVGGPIDARTDLYALGCLFHEVLTGSAPPLRLGLTSGPPALPARILGPLSPAGAREADAVRCELLAQAPAHRPCDAGSVADRFEWVARQKGAGSPAPATGFRARPPADHAAITEHGVEMYDDSYALLKTQRRTRPRTGALSSIPADGE